MRKQDELKTCKVDETAAISAVATRLLAARVSQLASVTEEPVTAQTDATSRRAAVTAPRSRRGAGDDRSPPDVTTAALASGTDGRPTPPPPRAARDDAVAPRPRRSPTLDAPVLTHSVHKTTLSYRR